MMSGPNDVSGMTAGDETGKQSLMQTQYSHIAAIPRALLIGYKATLSTVLYAFGVRCRHEPSCSEYAAEAWTQHGFLSGVRLGIGRILRCRPGGTSGYDPVPEQRPGWHMIKPTTTTRT